MTDNQRSTSPKSPHPLQSCFAQQPTEAPRRLLRLLRRPGVRDTEIGGGKVVIDDLILCEDCVKAAAQLIGLDDVERHCEEIQSLKRGAEGRSGTRRPRGVEGDDPAAQDAAEGSRLMALAGTESWVGGFVVVTATGQLSLTTSTSGAAWWGGFMRDPDGRLVVSY
jgi:hypothetical protein